MRITSSQYYDNLYANNNAKISKDLFDVNRQIASGLQIQYASDDIEVFTQTMRLDNEVTTLEQIKKSAESGFKISDQSDIVLSEFTTILNRMRTLLVQAANDTNDDTSRNSVALELRGAERNLKSLANTSINGQYLFAGSSNDLEPISPDGTYTGNDVPINAFLGPNNQEQFNITGFQLFLGEESSVKREVTSNVVNSNLSDGSALSENSKLRDLLGDKDNNQFTNNTNYFYVRGTKSSGESFNSKIVLSDDLKVSDLLTKIGTAYGNTTGLNTVNVSLNDSGQIVVSDKQKGSSKLDFHIVAAVDYSGGTAADVTNIDDLEAGETTFPPSGNLFVKEFIKSGLTSTETIPASTIEGLRYDRTEFAKNATTLTSNISQVTKDSNAFAKPSTLLSEVADLSQGTPGTLSGTKINLVGKNLNNIDYNVTINLDSAGSTFTDNLTSLTYDIFNVASTRVATAADEVTYQQLLDVANIAITGSIPAVPFANAGEYDVAARIAQTRGNTGLTYDGKIEFRDSGLSGTPATLSIFDSNSGKFGGDSSAFTFNSNNALTIRDPKTDFFKTIDEIITSVEDNKTFPDSSSGSLRSLGIENGIAAIDDLQNHITRSHSVVGAQSSTLTDALRRTEILKLSTEVLRSSIIDADLAEAALKLNQLTINYEALLLTIGKVSQLSLVNYL